MPMVLYRLVILKISDGIVPFKLLSLRASHSAKKASIVDLNSENGEKVKSTKNATAMSWSKSQQRVLMACEDGCQWSYLD